MLSALNDSLLREFLKILSLLVKAAPILSSAATRDVSVVLDADSMLNLSRMLCSYSRELAYVLMRRGDDTSNVVAETLYSKLLVWLPNVARMNCALLCSDAVSLLPQICHFSCFVSFVPCITGC